MLHEIYKSFCKLHNNVCYYAWRFWAGRCYFIKFWKDYYLIKLIYCFLFERDNDFPKTATNIPRVKLPELRLLKFNGDVQTFISFVNVYNALVHNKYHLSNTEKFSYLHGVLEGPPKNLYLIIILWSDFIGLKLKTLFLYRRRIYLLRKFLDFLCVILWTLKFHLTNLLLKGLNATLVSRFKTHLLICLVFKFW